VPTARGRDASSPGGMELDAERGELWVTLSRGNAVGVIALENGELRQIEVGRAPYAVVFGPDDKAYVTNWAGRAPRARDATAKSAGTPVVVDERGVAASGTVSVVDRRAGREVAQIEVGLHPSGLVLSPDRSRLYVANANSDTVSVIDTRSDTVVETISVV